MKTESGKRILIFFIVAYGMTMLMSLPMFLGFMSGVDLNVFKNARMMYPAAGVIIGMFVTDKENKKLLPRGFFITFLITTCILVIMSLLSVLFSVGDIDIIGIKVPVYLLAMIIGSVVSFVFILMAGKERRDYAGLSRKYFGRSALIVALFVVLYMARTAAATLIEGLSDGNGIIYFTDWMKVFEESKTWGSIIALPIIYFFVFIAYFGEEYGWRYFLQPIMQNRFGKRLGVILLGVLWGVWHIIADLMYYTTTTGVQMVINQLIVCIALGIFFAYAYMKTENIWVPVLLHFLNNNLIPIITGNNSMDALQNQSLRWSDLLVSIGLAFVFFSLFIFSKVFNKDK